MSTYHYKGHLKNFNHVKHYCFNCGRVHKHIDSTVNPYHNKVKSFCPYCFGTNTLNLSQYFAKLGKTRSNPKHAHADQKNFDKYVKAMRQYNETKLTPEQDDYINLLPGK